MRTAMIQWGLVAALCAMSANASAALGARLESVEADRAALSAQHQSSGVGALTVHTLTRANGGLVREYIDGTGTVIAVVWSGPSLPNLEQLLGAEHFARFAAAQRVHSVSHRFSGLHDDDLVVESHGSMRHEFSGRAYLPGSLSSQVTVEQFQ